MTLSPYSASITSGCAHRTSAELGYGDGVVANQQALTDFPGSPVPRLSERKVAYHCRLYDSHRQGPTVSHYLCRNFHLYVSDEAIQQVDNRYVIDAY